LEGIQEFPGAFVLCDGKAVIISSAEERVAAVGSCLSYHLGFNDYNGNNGG
jgi:hypothetical protein